MAKFRAKPVDTATCTCPPVYGYGDSGNCPEHGPWGAAFGGVSWPRPRRTPVSFWVEGTRFMQLFCACAESNGEISIWRRPIIGDSTDWPADADPNTVAFTANGWIKWMTIDALPVYGGPGEEHILEEPDGDESDTP